MIRREVRAGFVAGPNGPASHPDQNVRRENGAGEEIRTLDIHLGKVALYH
jgi:hypothetical protein